MFLVNETLVECWILEINQYYLSSSSQILEKFEGSSNIFARKLIFWDSSQILWFPLKTVLSYNKCQNTFLYGILKIKPFYFCSSSQTFQKKQRGTNIWEGTNILSSYTYILVLCKFLWKIRDCHWMINIKITFYVWELINWT